MGTKCKVKVKLKEAKHEAKGLRAELIQADKDLMAILAALDGGCYSHRVCQICWYSDYGRTCKLFNECIIDRRFINFKAREQE